MIIHSRLKDYEVDIEDDLSFMTMLLQTDNKLVVVDQNVFELYHQLFMGLNEEQLILIEATETNKVLATALSICEKMTSIPAKRNALLISVGGGIIQDITGFAANILYRGIPWIYVPTTLLASCDSCIGGKTSLNYKGYKNLLGTFYPPDKIYVCSHFFQTLTDRDYKSGLGEVVKFNIMSGREGLDNITDNMNALLERNLAVINRFVNRSLLYKKQFIEIDEFDRGERIKLNFAHTFGHAIEVVTDYGIPHGTAVAMGMVMADRVSLRRGLLTKDFLYRSESLLLRIISVDPYLYRLDNEKDRMIEAMRKDKKQTGASLTAVLLKISEDNGETELILVHDLDVEEVTDAVRYFLYRYSEYTK